MILGVAEDFSSTVVLDSELTSVSTTGLVLNSGVHPSITIDNLLSFLAIPKVTFTAWDDATIYGIYSTTKKRSDIVSHEGILYQSLVDENEDNQPDESTDEWLPTNIESLTLKSFIDKVKDKVYSDLSLTKRLINSQLIYEVGKYETTLPVNYAAWVFEPKGSDYVTITLNQICFQAMTTDDVNLYVINQGVLVDTLILKPNNGILEFKDYGYSFKGQGDWKFVIDSDVVVLANQGFVDELKYDGFVCYTAAGLGDAPETAIYNKQTRGNGLGFNVSVTLDSSVYIDNNFKNLGTFIRSTFELMTLQVFLHNSSNRSNSAQRTQQDRELLVAETKALDMNTIAKRYQTEYENCKDVIRKTFDTQLYKSDELSVDVNSL